jgi:hypothetical protein
MMRISFLPFLNRQPSAQSTMTTQESTAPVGAQASASTIAAVASINPTAALILFGVEEAVKLYPDVEAELQRLFSKGIPTEDDWAASRARIALPFSALAPNSAAQIAAAEATAGEVAPPIAEAAGAPTPPPAGAQVAVAKAAPGTLLASEPVGVQSLSAPPVGVQVLTPQPAK